MMVWLIWLVVFAGCSNNAVSPEDESLSQVMSLSSLSKSSLVDAQGAVVGMTVSVDVINTGPVSIDRAFVMTWKLRDSQNAALATTTHRFAGQPFQPAERRRVILTMSFAARPNLSGVQDVVTFAFE